MTQIQDMPQITEEEFAYAKEVIQRLSSYYDGVVVGQQELKMAFIRAILADGHILIESVPGLAKTTAAKAIASAINAKFSRIQCTPDLLPSDIIGTQIYNQAQAKFQTILGPIFANFVLLDEVNRSSSKTQSAMLEAMQEKQVTIAERTYKMPEDLFLVIATQNPIEQEGTYPLSEAQTDRFMIKEVLTYPTPEEETAILSRMNYSSKRERPAVLEVSDIHRTQEIVDKIYVDVSIRKYIATLVHATRNATALIGEEYGQYVKLGASPRASIAFLRLAKVVALEQGRNYVIPEDVKAVRYQVLRHRISLSYSAKSAGISVENIIDELFAHTPTP
ncbi:MAG: MoxR family ATPase [Solobacterium sp.]|nr:MoxR family ATPase [Solobacterium sp.]